MSRIVLSFFLVAALCFFCLASAVIIEKPTTRSRYERLKERIKKLAQRLSKHMPDEDSRIAIGIIVVAFIGAYGWRWHQIEADKAVYSDDLRQDDITLVFDPETKKPGKSILKQIDNELKDKKKVVWDPAVQDNEKI